MHRRCSGSCVHSRHRVAHSEREVIHRGTRTREERVSALALAFCNTLQRQPMVHAYTCPRIGGPGRGPREKRRTALTIGTRRDHRVADTVSPRKSFSTRRKDRRRRRRVASHELLPRRMRDFVGGGRCSSKLKSI